MTLCPAAVASPKYDGLLPQIDATAYSLLVPRA